MPRVRMIVGVVFVLFFVPLHLSAQSGWEVDSLNTQEPEYRFLNQMYADSMALYATYPKWVVSQLWLRDLVKQYIYETMKWQAADGHIFDGLNQWRIDDEAELFLNWMPYYFLSGDEKVYTAVRKALFVYLSRTRGGFEHGYFKDPYYDTEHTLEALILLANLAYAKPNDTEVIAALRDLVEHCANLVPDSTPWFNTQTKHLRSIRPGTRGIDESCPTGVDWPFNLQFVKMALAYYHASQDVRYLTWAGEYLDGWIASLERNERENGVYLMPWEVDPKTGALGPCSKKWWYCAHAPDWGWQSRSMESVRDMRGAFLDYYSLTGNRRYMDAIKKQVYFVFAHSSTTAPAILYKDGVWTSNENGRSYDAGPVSVAASLLDDEIQPAYETYLLRWYETIDSPSLEQLFWHFRRYGKSASMQGFLDRAIRRVQSKVNEIKAMTTLPDPDDFPDLDGVEGLTMSYFGALASDRGEMPWTDVLYFKQSGALGIEEGVASVLETSDDSLRVLSMYNTNSQSKTVKLQAGYIPKIIRSLQINLDTPVAVKAYVATVTLPPEQVVRVTLRITGHDTLPPLPPSSVRTLAASTSSIRLAWDTPPMAADNETAALYQIERNGILVTRTDSLTFTDTGLLDDTVYQYGVYSIDFNGNVSSTAASGRFSTAADRTAPSLLSATLSDSTTLVLRFSEIVTLATAGLTANYAVTPGVQVLQAVRSTDRMGVTLKTSAHQPRTPYTVVVTNVSDSSKARNLISGARLSYTYIQTLKIANLSQPVYKVRTVQTNDSVFVDRAYTIQSLPDELLNRLRIVTANNDKGSTAVPFLSFTVNQHVNVYVAYDRRLTVLPTWLQSWTSTSAVVKTSDSEFLCYRKNFQPGLVNLGGNFGTGSCSMYMVFVEPGDDRTPPAPPSGLVALP